MARLSVLLPTRNGGPYLDRCIRSVLTDSEADVELVVSDNANTDETASVLSALADDRRLVTLRQEQLLNVTDNWQAALDAASGDYLLMLGDDDLLRPGAVDQIDDELRRFGDPDCLTVGGVRYVAPGGLQGVATSMWASPYFVYDDDLPKEGWLEPDARRALVADMYRFRFRFPLTMQVTVIARGALQAFPGDLFRSPFPDHYAVGGLMLTADRWAVSPIQPIIVGVSLKSFGQFFFRGRDDEGLRYLGVDGDSAATLPGSGSVNAQAAWLSEMHRDFRHLLADGGIDRGEYVLRQAWTWLRQLRSGALSPRGFLDNVRLLTVSDGRAIARALARAENLSAAATALRRERAHGADRAGALATELRPLPDVADIGEFARWLDRTLNETVRR